MSKIILKQLLDLHGLEEGNEFSIGGKCLRYKIVDGTPCYKASGTGYVSVDEEDMILALAVNTVTMIMKHPQKPKYGERYFTLVVYTHKWNNDIYDRSNLENDLVFMDEDEAEFRLEEMVKLWKESNK